MRKTPADGTAGLRGKIKLIRYRPPLLNVQFPVL